MSGLAVGLVLVLVAPMLAWGQQFLEGYRGSYRGQVLDAETREPLAGAVVVAAWSRIRILPHHAQTVFHAARETLTGPDGRFVLEGKDIEEDAPPRTRPPEFLIFSPGYGPWGSLSYGGDRFFHQRGFQEGVDLRDGLTIGLPKLRTREEERQALPSATSLGVLTSGDRVPGCNIWLQPRETLANFLRLLNEAHTRAGLPLPYDPAYDKGGSKCPNR